MDSCDLRCLRDSGRAGCQESECVRIFFNSLHFETRRLKANTKWVGIHRDQCVSHVDQAHGKTLKTVTSEKDTAGLQYAPDFTQHAILQVHGWNVVQHGEGHG